MSYVVYKVETEREDDGRWIAEVAHLPGAMAYGATEKEAVASAQALALRIFADRTKERKKTHWNGHYLNWRCPMVLIRSRILRTGRNPTSNVRTQVLVIGAGS
jgi:predicted RNase H-like HicB family nuclease